jgi:2-polyprenyl-6-methoxyphenol hydroxylase-like FAD-dependent oxidoreductase
MTGYLLARAGVQVAVLEKHADFFRDFRGDTIHPSTLELMFDLGLVEEFLNLPHQELHQIRAVINGQQVTIADFSYLPTRCKFIAFMPQWDFLNFLASAAKKFDHFSLHMQHEVVGLIFEGERVSGVRIKTPGGERTARADLVIGADGRHGITHVAAGFEPREFGVPIDVLWLRLSKGSADPEQTLGYFRGGKLLVLIDRGDYHQAGLVIAKGAFREIQARGLAALQAEILSLAPFLGERVREIDDWSKIRLLTVQINRLHRWAREGLLCIGDNAHAMSPAGGVGINLAIQDAVATANLLAEKLRSGGMTLRDLEQVQRRREWPTKIIQAVQVFIHRFITVPGAQRSTQKLPLLAKMLLWFPALRRIPARLVGMGPRPEHIHSRPS